jgi:hypothetical protein
MQAGAYLFRISGSMLPISLACGFRIGGSANGCSFAFAFDARKPGNRSFSNVPMRAWLTGEVSQSSLCNRFVARDNIRKLIERCQI